MRLQGTPWFAHFAVLIWLCVAVLILISGCGKKEEPADKAETPPTSQTAAESVQDGGDYRVPLLNSPRTLDPAYVQDDYGATVTQQLFDGLVQFSPELYVTPALARTWLVEDGGKTYRFLLRPDAKFHNGRTVTSEDVEYSLRRLLRLDPAPFVLPMLLKIVGAEDYRERQTEEVAGLDAPTPDSFIVRLTEPYAPFLATLGMFQTKIVPADLVRRDEKGFGLSPVGSGPFRFDGWEPNKSISLQRFEGYFGGAPHLDRLIFKIYPGGDADIAVKDFLDGKLEEMPVYGSIRDRLTGRSDLHWMHRASLSLLFYGFNCQNPLFKRKEVRELLAGAVDRQKLVASVYGGQFEPAVGILPPGMPGYQPEAVGRHAPHGPTGTVQEISGRPADEPIELEIVSAVESPQSKQEIAFVQKAWEKVGVTVHPRFITDWGEFEDYLASDAVQVYRYVWFADIPHPDNFLQPLFGPHALTNYMKFRDPKVADALVEGRVLTDPLNTAKAYQAIEKLILDDMPMVPLFYLSIDRVYKPEVKGVQMSALGFAYSSFRSVYFSPAVSR